MEVNVKQAIKLFFSKSSFEMIYLEAFANALDAEATKFTIEVSLSSYTETQNLIVKFTDNGVGFTDKRFDKFSRLLDSEESTHKELGRLAYLCYFDNVFVESHYDHGKLRSFRFFDNYSKECTITDVEDTDSGTSITLKDFNGERLKKNENVRAAFIKKLLLENFYIRFHNTYLHNKPLRVSIKCNIAGKQEEAVIDESDLPDFKTFPIEGIRLFKNLTVYYNISDIVKDDTISVPSLITALSIDDRCFPVEVISKENVPTSHNMIFLLVSESLFGATDESRQKVKIEESELKSLLQAFRTAISTIVKKEVPKIAEANQKQFKSIQNRFPHLSGLIDEDCVGYLSYNDVLNHAQDKYFKAERELLGATALSDEQFERSLEFSSRALASYIVFRQKLIERMKSMTHDELESELHNLLSLKRHDFKGSELENDLYLNNVWLLDDKFMTYERVLSEAYMSDVLRILSPDETTKDDGRPDISIFFSNNPNDGETSFDIVIIELKRLGIGAEKNSIVEFQLDERTQSLASYFNNRIQRAWFYGIVEMDNEYKLHLRNNEYKPLFSHGDVYFKSKRVYTNLDDNSFVIQNSFIMDFKALVNDADSRNETFLRVLKEKFAIPDTPF